MDWELGTLGNNREDRTMKDHLPPGWGDADWWRRANTIKDVGEQYARARREADRLRRLAAARRAFAERMGL